MNLTQYCLTNAAADPGKTALEVVGPGGDILESWTYGDLTDTILSVASGLAARGLHAGDRVLLRIGHSSDFPIMFFGAIAGGFVPVPSSDQLKSAEAAKLLSDSGARLILHDGRTALPENSNFPVLGPEELEILKKSDPGIFAKTGRNDPAFMIYTSGTSGRPKGVLHAQRAAQARTPAHTGWMGLSAADRLLHAGAFNWSYTLSVGLMDPWINGATSIIYDGDRSPDVWPGLLAASRATLFAAVPSLYRRILKYGEVAKNAFPDLRHGLTAGEALPAELYFDWKNRTGRELYEALGMSEVSTYISSGPQVPVRPGSMGKPQPGRKVSIRSEAAGAGEPAALNEAGILAVHRDEAGLMLGYWHLPEETASAFHGDWFLTGDRVRQDEDGYYWYEGRTDDVMNAFGYRVAPQEVERVLSAHPQVQEVAVAALPFRAGVDLITAFVVPKEPGVLDIDDLGAHAEAHLADYKLPKEYRVVDRLPRSPSGKLSRKALVASQKNQGTALS